MSEESSPKRSEWDPVARPMPASGTPAERGFFADLLVFAWENKLWWITPAVVILVLLAVMVWFARGESIAPFFYALF